MAMQNARTEVAEKNDVLAVFDGFNTKIQKH